MGKTVKIKKEINGKTFNDIKYKVDQLEIDDTYPILFGKITINEEIKYFQFNFTNSEDTDYFLDGGQYDNKIKDEVFEDALDDLYENHIFEIRKNKVNKDKNVVIEKTIKIV